MSSNQYCFLPTVKHTMTQRQSVSHKTHRQNFTSWEQVAKFNSIRTRASYHRHHHYTSIYVSFAFFLYTFVNPLATMLSQSFTHADCQCQLAEQFSKIFKANKDTLIFPLRCMISLIVIHQPCKDTSVVFSVEVCTASKQSSIWW